MRLLLIGCTLLAIAAPRPSTAADRPIDVKVLYAGNPGSDREKAFVDYLKTVFKRVETADYPSFREDRATGHDVVILDWTSIYPRDDRGKILKTIEELNYPKVPTLSENYDRPTILIGGAGELVAKSLRLKIDWRCLCLDRYAHEMATAHPIFHEPFEVAPTLEDVPSPADLIHWDGMPSIGKTMKVWKVQEADFPVLDPGLLSNAQLFEDSPDAEIVSAGGVSGRGVGSVALGRHGNFFLWGFSAPPDLMTAEGRRCFANAICYIRRFDGQKPVARLSRKRPFSRQNAILDARGARTMLDPELFRRKFPQFGPTPEAFEKNRKIQLTFLNQAFPEEIRQRGTTDPGAYLAWVDANRDWLCPGPDHEGDIEIAVDEDAKAVGPAIGSVALLETCVAMLERGDRPELASRVLRRYTAEARADARGWRAWLDSARERIFFTEAGGFKYLVAPASMTPPYRAPRLPISSAPSPSRDVPVVVAMECSPVPVRAGEPLTLTIRFTTAPAWHITAMEGSSGPEVATTLTLRLPEGVEPEGDWVAPTPDRGPGGRLSHEGEFAFRRRLVVKPGVPAGPITLACKVGYQACDPASCRPHASTTLETLAEVVGGQAAAPAR